MRAGDAEERSRRRPTGTRLFDALAHALADVPRERMAGDHHDHRRRGARRARPDNAAAASTPAARAADRRARRARPPRIVVDQRAALRHRRQGRRAARPGRGPRRQRASRCALDQCTTARRRSPRRSPIGARRRRSSSTLDHAGAEHRSRSRSTPAPGELTTINNRAVRGDQRRARPAARAAGLGRAASRRARLAQPAEGRPVGRPRPLHHPAPAREAGRARRCASCR